MKKKWIICVAIALSFLMIAGSALAAPIEMIPLMERTSGIFERNPDGSIRLAGRTPDNTGDDYLQVHNILKDRVSDFEWSFDYTPTLASWNADKFCFRTNNTNEWGAYQLLISGNSKIQINENPGHQVVTLVKGEAYANVIGSYAMELVPNTTYNVKIDVKGAHVKIWFVPDGGVMGAPQIEADLPNDSGYALEYIPNGDLGVISWAGDFTLANMLVSLPGARKVQSYPNNTVCVAGPAFRNQENPLTDKWYTSVPVDLSQNGSYTFPLVGGNCYMIGEATIRIDGDLVKTTYKYYNKRSGGYDTQDLSQYLNFFGDYAAVTTADLENLGESPFKFGQTYSIAQDFGGDTEVLMFIVNRATFYDANESISRYLPDEYIRQLRTAQSAMNGMSADGHVIGVPVGVVTDETDLIPMVEAEAGYVYHEGGALRVSGVKPDGSGDAYTDTWHITRQKYSDFELSWDYTPARVEWNQDRICFRCAGDENGWNQYMVMMRGFGLGDKAGISLVKGEAWDNPYALVPFDFFPGTTYRFKLVVKDHDVSLYFGEGDDVADEPLIAYTLPDDQAEGADYRDIFIDEGDFQIITWGGDFTMTYFNLLDTTEND